MLSAQKLEFEATSFSVKLLFNGLLNQ